MSESEPGDSATPADSASAQDASWVGRVIDERYRIDQVLDEGGMGAVFIAEHLKLQKSVAFKVILPKLAGDPELAQRFAREGMVSAKLEHPHIASAIDSGTLPDGGAYLVMQLARGRGLRAWMGRGADWRLAARIGMQLADALAAAHAHGIVHRDLKPENVKVEDRDGALHARVLDFGIARVSEPPSAGGALTRIGSIMGTPGYMAPEQAVGEAVDARADVYALGVILWELATGETLFDQEDFGAITTAQFSSPAPSLRETCPDVPPELDALIARMLEVSKDKRPADGAEVRDVLRRVVLAGSIAMPAPRQPSAPSALEAARTQGALSTVRAGVDSATELAPRAT